MSNDFRSLIAALLLASGLLAAPAVIAQDATPPAGEVIDPAECQVEARTVEGIEQIAGGAPASEGAATPDISEIGALTGEPAGEATVEAVTATYRELVACLNAGDYLRVYALYSDDYIQRTLAEGEMDAAQFLATPAPDDAQETALVGISDVRQLDGGRIAARVETADPTGDGSIIIDAVLVQEGDRYLIDAETVVDAPDMGTPAAAGAGEEAAASDTSAAAEVVSYDIYFEPTEFTIPVDTDVTVTLPNEGVTLHNFVIDELGIDVDIDPGATEETVINAPAGVYEFYCNVPGHKAAGMLGTMTVE